MILTDYNGFFMLFETTVTPNGKKQNEKFITVYYAGIIPYHDEKLPNLQVFCFQYRIVKR
jgi:hypothetical protein